MTAGLTRYMTLLYLFKKIDIIKHFSGVRPEYGPTNSEALHMEIKCGVHITLQNTEAMKVSLWSSVQEILLLPVHVQRDLLMENTGDVIV